MARQGRHVFLCLIPTCVSFVANGFFLTFSYWIFVFTVDLLVYPSCWICGFQLVPPNVCLGMAYKSRFISKVQFINFPFPGLHLHCQVWQFCQALDSKQFLLRFSCKFHGSLLHLSPWPILRSCLYAVWGCAKALLSLLLSWLPSVLKAVLPLATLAPLSRLLGSSVRICSELCSVLCSAVCPLLTLT